MDWQQVKRVMGEAAARQSAAERAAYLDEACRGDAPLRVQVEKLLRAHAQATRSALPFRSRLSAT